MAHEALVDVTEFGIADPVGHHRADALPEHGIGDELAQVVQRRLHVAAQGARVGFRRGRLRQPEDRRRDELELRRVAAVDRRLADAGTRGDGVDTHPVETVLGVLLHRGAQDLLVALGAARAARLAGLDGWAHLPLLARAPGRWAPLAATRDTRSATPLM